jgi:hypothetical protein
MEIKGNVFYISEPKEGGEADKKWKTVDFGVETDEEYPQKFIIGIWSYDDEKYGFKANKFLKEVAVGTIINTDARGRANQSKDGRWFGQLSMWNFSVIGDTAATQTQSATSTPVPEIPAEGDSDSLPF